MQLSETVAALSLQNVTHCYVVGLKRRREILTAVSDVSLEVYSGQTLGIVGESGSGKSTIGRILSGLLVPTKGELFFEGQLLSTLSQSENRLFRRRVQVVFQDSRGSLNPRMRVRDIVMEPWVIHGMPARPDESLVDLLQSVGLGVEHVDRFPLELSGGQRQRVGIARALACDPKVLICDEAVASLDVSVQAQVMSLLSDLNRRFGLTIVFIAHDISVVRALCQNIVVTHLGSIVEAGETGKVCDNPRHPYTSALLSAVPTFQAVKARERIVLIGELPSPLDPPSGCSFRTRCWRADDDCSLSRPDPQGEAEGHSFSCFHPL